MGRLRRVTECAGPAMIGERHLLLDIPEHLGDLLVLVLPPDLKIPGFMTERLNTHWLVNIRPCTVATNVYPNSMCPTSITYQDFTKQCWGPQIIPGCAMLNVSYKDTDWLSLQTPGDDQGLVNLFTGTLSSLICLTCRCSYKQESWDSNSHHRPTGKLLYLCLRRIDHLKNNQSHLSLLLWFMRVQQWLSHLCFFSFYCWLLLV